MTCVIAWTNHDRMIMASDSAVTSGDRIMTMKQPKFQLISSKQNPDMLIGYAGRAKVGQVILDLHVIKIPKDTTPDPYIFMTQTIVPILEEILSEYRLTIEDEDTGEIFHENIFIIAYRGSLFTINSEFHVFEGTEDFVSIGSGQDYALSAMTAIKNGCPDILPEKLIEEGMRAAEKYSSSVRGPFKMFEISATESSYVPMKPVGKKNKKGKKPKKQRKEEPVIKKTSLID